ncbi:MAG: DUF1800 domain-containing protein [Bacteroidota bacterium]
MTPAVPLALATSAALAGCTTAAPPVTSRLRLPYRDAGLSDRQAAAHALDRLAFGPTPGAVDRVLAMGLETWIEQQIAGDLPDPDLDARIEALPDYRQSLTWLAQHYRRSGGVSREAIAAGYIPPDAEKGSDAYREGTQRYMRERGIQNFRELIPVLLDSKIYPAVYAKNQLREVLADFWFNHFNVTARGGNIQSALVYDRDAIRPNVLAPFRQILGTVARHPGMLHYLDNERSKAAPGAPTPLGPAGGGGGINENYGRELLELHTLGVDGGYTQADVEAVARAFTGWTVWPYTNYRRSQRWMRDLSAMPGALQAQEFTFRPDWHDAGEKIILGQRFPAGRGMEDGEDVLDLVAAHPSTSRHLARKLAVKFVADEPSDTIVEDLAEAFQTSGGDTREVLRALVQHPAFWEAATGADGQPSKVKTPFELVISAVRATGGEVQRTRTLARALEEMGEPIYHREPPTGFPDHAAAWINPGLLLNRMSFGLQLATGGLRGVRVRLGTLTGGREPESAAAALVAYGDVLLPGRDLGPTSDVLEEMVLAQNVAQRVQSAAEQAAPDGPGSGGESDGFDFDDDAPAEMGMSSDRGANPERAARRQRRAEQQARRAARDARDARDARRNGRGGQTRRQTNDAMPAPSDQVDAGIVVGVLLGSPAFQRQ